MQRKVLGLGRREASLELSLPIGNNCFPGLGVVGGGGGGGERSNAAITSFQFSSWFLQ